MSCAGFVRQTHSESEREDAATMKTKAGDSEPLFKKEDSCLCFHGPMVYGAKVGVHCARVAV